MSAYRCTSCGTQVEAVPHDALSIGDTRYVTARCRCTAYPKRATWQRVVNPVIAASDAVTPVVHDNVFSREALEKVMASGRDKSMRRTMLATLQRLYPDGLSSSEFEQENRWLHQSASAALNGLEKAGLVAVVRWRVNARGNREGVYAMTALAHAAWAYEP